MEGEKRNETVESPPSFYERWSASAKEKISSLKGHAKAWVAEVLVSKSVVSAMEKSRTLAPISTLTNLAELDPDVLFKPEAAQAREHFRQTRIKIATEAVRRIDVVINEQNMPRQKRQALIAHRIKLQRSMEDPERIEEVGQNTERMLADLDAQIARQHKTRPLLEDSRERLKFIIDTESGNNRVMREAIDSAKDRYALRDAIVKLNKSMPGFLGKQYLRGDLQRLNVTIFNYIGIGDGLLTDIPLTANLRSKVWQLRQEVMRTKRLEKEAELQLAESSIPENLEDFVREGPELTRIQRSPRQWAVLWKLYTKNGKITPEQVLEKRAFATGPPMTLEEYESKHLQEQDEKTREGFVDTLAKALKGN